VRPTTRLAGRGAAGRSRSSTVRHPDAFQRLGEPMRERRGQHGAEHGQSQAGRVVADGLGDPRDLAVRRTDGVVDRVGAGRAHDQAEPGTRHHDVRPLVGQAEPVEV
jgi:hypothetical protein